MEKTKTLLNINKTTRARFEVMYVGARLLAYSITRSTLNNGILASQLSGKQFVLIDSKGVPFTAFELFKLGVKTLNSFWDSLDKEEVQKLKLNNQLTSRECLIKCLAIFFETKAPRRYMVDTLNGIPKFPNLGRQDLETLASVITESTCIEFDPEEECYVKNELFEKFF